MNTTRVVFVCFISSYLNIVKIYVECCEGLCEGFVSPRQPAQSLCSVRLHGVIWLRAAAHRAAELPSCKHGQTAHLWHTHPVCNDRHLIWPCTRITFWKDSLTLIYISLSLSRTHTHGGLSEIQRDVEVYLWCLRISRHSTAIPNTVAPAGMTWPVTDCSWNSLSPLFRTRHTYWTIRVHYSGCFKSNISSTDLLFIGIWSCEIPVEVAAGGARHGWDSLGFPLQTVQHPLSPSPPGTPWEKQISKTMRALTFQVNVGAGDGSYYACRVNENRSGTFTSAECPSVLPSQEISYGGFWCLRPFH